MFYVFAVLTALIVTLQITKHWLLSKGVLWWVYRLNMVIFVGYFITETLVALSNPAQLPLIFMNIVNVWAFAMAYKGYLRLKKQEDEEGQQNSLVEKEKLS